MSYLSPQITTNHRKKLLCISSQGLITVHAPNPPVTQKSPSVLTLILRFLFFFPRLLYQAIKSPLNSFAHPFRTPISNIPNTSSDDPQDYDDEQDSIQEGSTTPTKEFLEQSNAITISPTPYAAASPDPPNEFDLDNEIWKESWRFANHITYPLRIQIARGYFEGKIYHGQFYEDIVALRALEGRAWEEGVVDSEKEIIGMGREVMMSGLRIWGVSE